MIVKRGRINISPGFLLLAAFLFYIDGTVILWAGFAAALHELGHLFTLTALGGRVEAVHLTAIGAEMKLDSKRTLSYPRELVVALAGPAVSVLTALIAAKLGAYLFAGLSLALGVFNLLPVAALDGGRALYAVIAGLSWESRAVGVSRCVSRLVVALLVGLGAGVLHLYGNFTLLLAAFWLWSSLYETKGRKLGVRRRN